MTTTRFAVPGISCEGCKTAIEGALRPIAGVESVAVDLGGRVVDVVHEPQLDPVQLADAVEGQGYEVAARREVG
jgi:copper chaperone